MCTLPPFASVQDLVDLLQEQKGMRCGATGAAGFVTVEVRDPDGTETVRSVLFAS